MKTVRIKVNGDLWIDRLTVLDQLQEVNSTDWVCFDTGAEGISLIHSGILKFINDWVESSGHPVEKIVINSPNRY